MSRRRMILAGLIVTAIISTWILNHLTGTGSGPAVGGVQIPNYYMEDFTTLSMDENGVLKNRLYAVYMAHYEDDDTTELLRPRLEFYRPGRAPLLVNADKGWVTEGNEVILLDGNVEIREQEQAGETRLAVNTDKVRVLPNRGYAETDAYATIRSRRATVTGTGMRVDMAAGRLEVLNNVRTVIEHR